MKKLAVCFAMLALTASVIAAGQSASDPSIMSFWDKFKAAVIKGDRESIATMSQFPITMPYGIPSVKTRVQLLKRYREVFKRQADAAKCFAESRPEVDTANKNRFTVGCKDAAGNEVVIYGFVRTRGVWKLKSLDNINE